jgi:hypothetical protein
LIEFHCEAAYRCANRWRKPSGIFAIKGCGVALKWRKEWMLAVLGILALGALLGWAWADGGERPLKPMAETVVLPEPAR